MLRRGLLRPLVTGVGIVALQLLSASSAFAYFVTISANAVCTDGVPVINYTVGSWTLTQAGTNTAVNVLFNGTVVDTQPFVLPTNSFSGSRPAPAGASTVTVTAIGAGVWGDGFTGTGNPASTTVTIPTDCEEIAANGRFTGGPNAIEIGGAKVTTGLQIHCHPKDPSVNFEINWGGGENFHLTDVTTVSCFDSPTVTPQPPKAPVDTIVDTGFGTLNGLAGFTIEFTLVDSGEPDNKRTDQMRILIYTTGNPADVKLNVPLQNISAGNIQAHYDQPHGGNGNK
jgi:hypothetical protein